MANTFYANAVCSRCRSVGKIATKQCRCAAFQERLPCSHCPMHVLHAAVAGACEEQEEYLRESRHVCAPERSQTRPHTDTEHPTQPGVVDGVTGRPPRHVQRTLGQHAFCPRLPTEVALDTCTSNRHAVSSTSQPSRIHVWTVPQARLATAISSCSIRIRSIRNAPLGLGPQTRAVTIPYSCRPVVKTPPLERTTSARTYTNQLNGGR